LPLDTQDSLKRSERVCLHVQDAPSRAWKPQGPRSAAGQGLLTRTNDPKKPSRRFLTLATGSEDAPARFRRGLWAEFDDWKVQIFYRPGVEVDSLGSRALRF
jgi:hypothetical protein